MLLQGAQHSAYTVMSCLVVLLEVSQPPVKWAPITQLTDNQRKFWEARPPPPQGVVAQDNNLGYHRV